ncbi:MAG: hypothetical protein DRO52_04270 [Candidatus Hecatellales archaeon]|nr:MAG: hypothetical protein DRO52_04270 [Candidatus Hecatellales archaeon]
MAGRLAVGLAILLLAAVLAATFYLNPLDFLHKTYNPSNPAKLSFEVKCPERLKAGGSGEIVLKVSNLGGSTAENVEVLVEGSVFKVEAPSFNINPGEVKEVKGKISVLDVDYGDYQARFRLKYACGGERYSQAVKKRIYVLPRVEVRDVGWKTDLFNLFGKSGVKRGDSTTLHFRVKSLSEKVIYGGIKAKISLELKPEGLTISPCEVEIERIGPKGLSSEYSVTVATSSETPPGQYPIRIQLYTADDVPVEGAEALVKLTVSPD